jgi:O-antigen ligase
MTARPLFTPTAFLGALCLLAAFGCGMFFGGYQDVIYAPAIIALLAFSLLAVLPGCWRGLVMPSSPFALAVFAFWLYVTLSLLWSTVPFSSLVTYLIALVMPLTFFSLMMTQDRMAWLSFCGAMLLMAILAAAVWAVAQVLVLGYGRAHDPLPNANSLAALLNLGLFAFLPFVLNRPRLDALALAAGGAAALCFAGIVATESRSALAAAAVALPLLCGMMRPDWRRVALLLAVFAVIFGGMQAATKGSMVKRLTHITGEHNPENTLDARFALWGSAWDMALEKPLGGTGLGTFYLYYPAHRKPLADNSAGSWVHNDPLQFAVEMGFLAPLLFYAILGLALRRTVAALRRAPGQSWLRAAIAGPFCALATMAIHMHVSFLMYLIPITLTAGVLAGVWYEATRIALAGRAPDRVVHFTGLQKPFMAAMCVAIALMLAGMAASSAAGMYYLQQARAAMARADIEQFIILTDKAERFAPASFIDPQVQMAGLNIDLLTPPAGLLLPYEQQNVLAQTEQMLDGAERMNPAWAEIDFKRGRLYAVTGAYGLVPDGADRAENAWRKAVAKNPMHYRAREELARALVKRGAAAEAYDILSAGLEYPLPDAIRTSYVPLMRQLQGIAAVQKKYRDRKPPESQTP